ncbi:MAG: DUF2914 domain-containing protein [Burkholderiales bacterium]|nr:DUF2914 domain-containing protein [Burkholderiales bacterium]MDR4516437.1 DUF2914 domain-containing protein [Nitrosomonas sp.]
MTDNKLKIRIQIQQPKTPEETGQTEVTGESIPVIDTQDYLEKPPFDWRKISLAVLALVAVIGLISVLLLSQNDDEADIGSLQSDTGSGSDPAGNFNYYNNNALKSTLDTQANSATHAENEKKPPSEIKDITETAKNTAKAESDNARIIVPDSKPNHANKHSPPAPAVKPQLTINDTQKTMTQNNNSPELLSSLPLNETDHPQVIRAQLTHAVKHREPVDEINHIQLEQDKRKSIYFFIELHDLAGQQVTISWYYQDQPVAETKLRIGGNNWRTYANKVLSQRNTGSWRAVLTDKDGKQLSERHFVVSNHL